MPPHDAPHLASSWNNRASLPYQVPLLTIEPLPEMPAYQPVIAALRLKPISPAYAPPSPGTLASQVWVATAPTRAVPPSRLGALPGYRNVAFLQQWSHLVVGS